MAMVENGPWPATGIYTYREAARTRRRRGPDHGEVVHNPARYFTGGQE